MRAASASSAWSMPQPLGRQQEQCRAVLAAQHGGEDRTVVLDPVQYLAALANPDDSPLGGIVPPSVRRPMLCGSTGSPLNVESPPPMEADFPTNCSSGGRLPLFDGAAVRLGLCAPGDVAAEVLDRDPHLLQGRRWHLAQGLIGVVDEEVVYDGS